VKGDLTGQLREVDGKVRRPHEGAKGIGKGSFWWTRSEDVEASAWVMRRCKERQAQNVVEMEMCDERMAPKRLLDIRTSTNGGDARPEVQEEGELAVNLDKNGRRVPTVSLRRPGGTRTRAPHAMERDPQAGTFRRGRAPGRAPYRGCVRTVCRSAIRLDGRWTSVGWRLARRSTRPRSRGANATIGGHLGRSRRATWYERRLACADHHVAERRHDLNDIAHQPDALLQIGGAGERLAKDTHRVRPAFVL